MKKRISLEELRKAETEYSKRIVLYGAGNAGEFIGRYLKKFGFKFVFASKHLKKWSHEMPDYEFISVDALTLEDYIIITPENPNTQEEIEQELRDRGIENLYYLDCLKWYDAVVSCYGEEDFGDTDKLEQDWRALKGKYNEINVYLMWASRIGEVIYRFQIMQVSLPAKPNQYNLVVPYTVRSGIANKRLMEIFGRYLHIVDEKNSGFWRYVFLKHASELNGEKYDWFDKYKETEHLLSKQPYVPRIEFSPSELAEAEEKFNKLSIKGEYVCVHARDPFYLAHHYNSGEKVWSYHNHRDFNITSFQKLADYLAEKNISVVRVGKGGKERLKNSNVIDFAMDSYDELLDLYLNSRCKYYVCTDTGALHIPLLFARNLILVNVPNLISTFFAHTKSGNEIYIPKLYYSRSKSRYLTLDEMLEFNWRKLHTPAGEWENTEFVQDISYIENTEDDILETYIEADKKYSGTWEDDEQGRRLQDLYSKIIEDFSRRHPICSIYTDRDIHEWFVPWKISCTFLKKHSFLVEEIQKI